MLRLFLICYFGGGLVCWSLLARTKVTGWICAALFAATGVIAGLMISGWAPREPHLREATGLIGATAALLLAGTLIEKSRPGVRALRASRRGRTGRSLSLAYCASMPAVLILCALVEFIGAYGPPMPPSTDTLPLAPGWS
jgi:hypothetical protein